MLDGNVPKSKTAVKGYVRAFDVRTGKRLWIFHTIPRPGEFGFDTWEKDSWSYTGNTGAWGRSRWTRLEHGLPARRASHWRSIRRPSARRGTVRRKHCRRRSLYRKAHLALSVGSPRIVGYGHPCAPMLVDFNLDGKVVKAVAQPTKQAYLYVWIAKPASRSGPSKKSPSRRASVPGEWYSPTQPIPSKPPVAIQDRAALYASVGEQAGRNAGDHRVAGIAGRSELAGRIVRSRDPHRVRVFANRACSFWV
jgi:quinoprotein glucose dehydrogenase